MVLQKSPEEQERGGGVCGQSSGARCVATAAALHVLAPARCELIHLHLYVLGHVENQVFLGTRSCCLGLTLGCEHWSLSRNCSKASEEVAPGLVRARTLLPAALQGKSFAAPVTGAHVAVVF